MSRNSGSYGAELTRVLAVASMRVLEVCRANGTAPGLVDSLTCPTAWLPKTV